MKKEYRRFMRWGSLVKNSRTGEMYKTIEAMDENKENVMAVPVEHFKRWELLRAWERNWKQDLAFRDRFGDNIESCIDERRGYEVSLLIEEITPEDKIRFITPDYQTKFTVKNFGQIMVNGKARKVFYLGECHFGFLTDRDGEGDIFHICEFAEICEGNAVHVEKIEPVKV